MNSGDEFSVVEEAINVGMLRNSVCVADGAFYYAFYISKKAKPILRFGFF